MDNLFFKFEDITYSIDLKTKEQKMAIRNCIALYPVGSHLYGTNTSESDFDAEGIFIEDPEYIIGRKRCDEVDFSKKESNTVRNSKEDIDLKLYSLRNFISLATNNNPNKISQFFIPDNLFLYKNERYWNMLKESKDFFISTKVNFSFAGYAFSQKRHLTQKRKRLEELREFKKTLEEGITDGAKIIGDLDLTKIIHHKKWSTEKGEVVSFPERIMKKKYEYIKYRLTPEGTDAIMVDDKIYNYGMDIQKIYGNISAHINAYGKRTKSLDEHSYDPKFSSHVFRLIDEGLQLLKTGTLTYPSPNAQFQLEVKQGKYDIDYLLEEMDKQFPLLDIAYKESKIQHSPNQQKIDELQQKMYKEFWKEKGYFL